MNAIADERGYWLVIGLIVLKLILFLAAFAALIGHSVYVGLVLLVIAPFIYPVGRALQRRFSTG